MCVCVCVYVCMYVCIYVYMYIYMCVLYVCVYVCVCCLFLVLKVSLKWNDVIFWTWQTIPLVLILALTQLVIISILLMVIYLILKGLFVTHCNHSLVYIAFLMAIFRCLDWTWHKHETLISLGGLYTAFNNFFTLFNTAVSKPQCFLMGTVYINTFWLVLTWNTASYSISGWLQFFLKTPMCWHFKRYSYSTV